MSAALFALLTAGCALGVWLIALGVRGTSAPSRRWTVPDHFTVVRLCVGVVAALLVGVITGWMAAAVLTGLAVALLPRVLQAGAEQRARLDRIEAIASWTEMLRDTLVAASGLEHAMLATAARAPEAIRPEVTSLAAQLRGGERLAVALRRLGDELHDPTADLVIAALVLSSEHQARHLAELLGELATEAREQASMRMRIEASRRQTRTSVRVIVITTITFAGGLIALNRAYLDPFDSLQGQLVLAVVGALFGLAFTWLARIARLREPDRLLVAEVPR
ncbi:Flp pilus assembly protein TadB [Lentzea xinjiangensis]|uniref:Flp pilus assembly protein TadB n=1 Tax=Lentzea xinjiangensis TaxID=402600 RepID=A0A1H9L9H7_9PSEU|nr:type II secretion system F family protein [Lentzea xinjiangensis]SER08030.1 Flp pilus assembly protein TadB [Lentzea xinjiangensis]